ncbi:MAG: response regulator [Fimbriimonadia bacterium]|nr:response regulator [Fimbriimonadia bacterium]
MTILIVDDEEILHLLLGDVLEKDGYQIYHAYHGQQALELMKTEAFDLLLTDIHMPVMSGIELIDQTHAQQPKLPIIVMDSYPHCVTQSHVSEWVTKVITKPFDLVDMRNAIQEVERNQLRSAA